MTGTTKTNKSFFNRRDFLKTGVSGAATVAGAALTPLLSSCAQMDRIIVGDGANETKSVLILGAGVSGLVAARELKKQGIPFRIFEASSRVGGRAYTLENFNKASQVADLGAEWISENDSFVLGLCKELKISTQTYSSGSRLPQFLITDKWNDFEKLSKEMNSVERRFQDIRDHLTDAQWDAISAEEMLGDLKSVSSASTTLWLRRLIQLEWGCEPSELSALTYLDRFGSNLMGLKRLQARRIKISGGTQNLAHALYDKISGVVPDRFVVFDHKLKKIKSKGDQLLLDFETKDGQFSIDARVVICTIPFSVLRHIAGVDDLDFSDTKLKAIQELGYGSHGKIVASYAEKFWNNKESTWTGDLHHQWLWDSSSDPGHLSVVPRGILSAQSGGQYGRELGLHSVDEFREDLKKIKGSGATEESYQIMNWSRHIFSAGSVAMFKPKQVHAFSSTLVTPERKGTFIFAGEHTSLSSMGTMNGAIESGLRSAMQASRFKSELNRQEI